jgi:pseudoazurin
MKRFAEHHLRVLALACVATIAVPARAEGDAAPQVRMLNVGSNGQATVFEPEIIHVAPGTSADFIAEDFGHDAVAVEGLIPAGAQAFAGYKNADLSVKFEAQGVYVYQCTAHQGAGMVGLVVVGDPKPNLDAVIASYRSNPKLSEKAKDKLALLLERVKTGS